MSRINSARRIAATAAYGGSGLVGVGAAAAGVLVAEGMLARRTIGLRTQSAPYADGYYGRKRTGTSLRFAVLGDSSAAGFGASSPLATLGALIAQGLVEAADRPVRYVNMSSVGARSADLDAQVTRALIIRPHIVVILVGGNDVTHLTKPQTAVGQLEDAVGRLTDSGAEVVVGTCPDIGTIKPIRQPLRWVARRLSRQLAAAQTIGVVEAGGRSVSLGNLLGPDFDAYPERMFAYDRFHPSDHGYAMAAQVLLPSVLDSLGLATRAEQVPDARLGDTVLPVATAAVEAADTVGTEVAATRVPGEAVRQRGRWAQMRHRIRHPIPRPEKPAPLSEEPAADTTEGARSEQAALPVNGVAAIAAGPK